MPNSAAGWGDLCFCTVGHGPTVAHETVFLQDSHPMTHNVQPPTRHSLDTSISLLDRVKLRDEEAWRRMARIYGPLVYGWARRSGLQAADAEDIVGEVFSDLVTGIERFRRDSSIGYRFRAWLRTICQRKIMKRWGKQRGQPVALGGTTANRRIESLVEPRPSDGTEETASDVSRVHHRALLLLRDEFKPHHWQAFWRTTVENGVPGDVAADLGMSVWAVYKARSRVLHRLRLELAEIGEMS